MLSNKTILLTGASAGIGREAAKVLASEGATLILVDYDEEQGKGLEKELSAEGYPCTFVKVDISKTKEVEALFKMIDQQYSKLDCAINNAGIAHPLLPLAKIDEQTFDRVININLKGTWLCMKHELDIMSRKGGGNIINMASVAGLNSAAFFGAYAASKHGVIGLTKTAAVEYAKYNIRVNALCPSPIRTPMFESLQQAAPDVVTKVAESNPMQRLGEPEEIAAAIAWLCSDSSKFITGTAIPIDGGYCA
ncbi:MAG: hypothetical protein COA74_02000 [Gammaproteobacteria bacterium]|nr:MAG: hypothetical protein COA74_02000 [Gammaproteobacteria bacterium]